jgi:hypothetical protein
VVDEQEVQLMELLQEVQAVGQLLQEEVVDVDAEAG